jgi:hypothetical protein
MRTTANDSADCMLPSKSKRLKCHVDFGPEKFWRQSVYFSVISSLRCKSSPSTLFSNDFSFLLQRLQELMSYVRSGREKGRSLNGFRGRSLKIPRRCCSERGGKNTSSWKAVQRFDFGYHLIFAPARIFVLVRLKLTNFKYTARCEMIVFVLL